MTKRILRNLFSLLVSLSLMIGISSCLKDEPEVPDTPEEPDAPIGGFEDFDIFSSVDCDEMIAVEGGTFTMGASSEKELAESSSNELPAHDVCLGDFYIGKYEVTQQLWQYVMNYSGKAADGTIMTASTSSVNDGYDYNYGVGPKYPANKFCYIEIVEIFLPRLNKITGLNYRLLTEAEWEYAARGGQKGKGYKYSGSNTIEDVAWFEENSQTLGNDHPDYGFHEVGTKSPNELGIYDMSGNAAEWCGDWFDVNYYYTSPSLNPTGPENGSTRVIRGGS